MKSALGIGTVIAFALCAGLARAADCADGPEGFDRWLADFKPQAVAAGIAPAVVDEALTGIAYDGEVIDHDRAQHGFGRDFAKFAARRVTPNRIKKGRTMLLTYAEALDAIEQRYGVPGPVLVAIWGLESEFGAGTGAVPTFTALATLAHDCRRPDRFQVELLAALDIVQKGLMQPAEMRGAWAGEIGQTQFMPSNYLRYAVAFEEGVAPDLIHNPVDALASTANFLKAKGWKRGQGWREGEPNYAALLEWNAAPAYAKTIGLFAERLGSE